VAFVVAHRSTLERLARESGIPPLRSLAVAGGTVSSARFVALPFDVLASGPDAVEGGDACEETRPFGSAFDRLAQPLLSPDATVVVVVETGAISLHSFEQWVDGFIGSLKVYQQADRSLAVRWRLVLIAPVGLDRSTHEALERLRQRRLMTESPASLFASCHLMSGLLRVAGDEGGIDSAWVWPEAVGELLLHLEYLGRSESDSAKIGPGGSWYRAWHHVRLLPLDPATLHEVVRGLHAIAVVPSESATEPTPISAGIARLAVGAGVEVPSGDSINAFADMESGEAERACRSRWDADSAEWTHRGARAADSLQRVRGRLDTTHEGAGGHHGSLSEQFWGRLHRDRSLLGWVSDGAFAEARDVAGSVGGLGDRWLRLFRFDAEIRNAREPHFEAARDLDRARDHSIGFRWRVLIASIVCLFVGFVLQSLVQVLAPDVIAGWLAIGGVAVSSLAAVLLVALLEHVAGARARDRLERSGRAIEQAVAAGIDARVRFAASGEELQRWSAWLMATAMARRRARRLRAIVDAATDSALAVEVEPTASVEIRQSLQGYRAATRLVLDDHAGVFAMGHATIARWRARRHGSSGMEDGARQSVDSLVGSVAEAAADEWSRFCSNEDSRKSGFFRELPTWIALHGIAERSRGALATGLVLEARSKLSEALTAKRFRTETPSPLETRQFDLLSGKVTDELDALSVRTALASGSGRLASAMTVWVLDAAVAYAIACDHSSVAPEGSLLSDLSAVALAHHDVELHLTLAGESVIITERSVGANDCEAA
jgi:hypothetical protein